MAAVTIQMVDTDQNNDTIQRNGVTSYPKRSFDISIGDTYNVPVTVYVGVTGDVEVIPFDGDESRAANSSVFKNVPQGSCVPVRVKQVVATSTTATNLVGIV